MTRPAAVRLRPARPGGRPCPGAVPPGPPWDPGERGGKLPLVPLDQALADGDAMFGTSVILAHAGPPPASLARQQARLRAIWQGLPGTRVAGGGVTHTASGMAFAELSVGDSDYLVGCGKAHHGKVSAGRPADIITGSCLFGADSVTGIAGGREYSLTAPEADGRSGAPFDCIALDERPHVYETEAAGRLGSLIGDIARLLAPAPVRVHAHVPAAEYALRGLALYARGYLTRAQCDRYAQGARRRGALVAAMLRAAAGPAAEIRVSSPMAWLGEVDPYQVPPALLPQLLRQEARRQGALWDVLAGDGPGSLQDLSHASYIHHYLTVAGWSQQAGSQLIVVENPDEEVIYRRAAAAGRQAGIRLDRAAGCYVHPRVVVREAAFGLTPLLYNCKDGRSPRTLRLAAVGSLRAAGKNGDSRLAYA